MFHRFIDRGQGRPIVALHGIGIGPELFEGLIEDLSADHRVLTPWLPGYGESPHIDDDPSFKRATRHLAADLEELGVLDAVVLGFSVGGYRALSLALHRPAVASILYLLAGPARAEPTFATAMRNAAAAVRSGADIASAFVRGAVSPRFAEEHPAVLTALEPLVRAVPPQTLASELDTIAAAENLLGAVSELQHPISIRAGEADAIVDIARSEEIIAAARRGSLERVPGAGHALLVEDAQGTAFSIRSALASSASAASRA